MICIVNLNAIFAGEKIIFLESWIPERKSNAQSAAHFINGNIEGE
jgi:hypothetical protein